MKLDTRLYDTVSGWMVCQKCGYSFNMITDDKCAYCYPELLSNPK